MAKLTHKQIAAHNHANEMLTSGRVLNDDDKYDIIESWHEGASHSNAAHSAFFTPMELAMSFAMEVPSGGRIIDLCAGIGILSVAASIYHARNPGKYDLTLVELNPDYCEVAQRLIPEARVICGSIFDPNILDQIGTGYDFCVSNPPFGSRNAAIGHGPRYKGKNCEYAVIDVASDIADAGAFIIPQGSAPFRHSQDRGKVECPSYETPEYAKFRSQTGIRLHPNIGIDTTFANTMWRGTTVKTEIAICDFQEDRARRNANSKGVPSQSSFIDLLAA